MKTGRRPVLGGPLLMKMLRFTSAGGSANLLLGSVFRWRAAVGVGGYFLLSTFAFPQGSLTPPPGTPAPTMKTLDQVDTHIDVKGEKRIDLQNAPAAAVTTTDANYHFIINQPGSYY